MNDSRSALWSPAKATLGLESSLPTTRERYGALAICAFLVVAAACAARYGQAAGPELRPFVLVAATAWSLADVLTAFLLLIQFYVNGTFLFGILAGAYAFSGFMTWIYLSAFPGVLRTAPLEAGEQQVAIYLWTIWHCSFPLLVMCAMFNNAGLGRVLSRAKIFWATGAVTATPIVLASVVAALIFQFRNALPHLVINGAFAPLWKTTFIPAVITLNTLACVVLLRRRGKMTALAMWLAVALFSENLDALLNLSTARYSYAWDTGKLITVFTSSVVLIMILVDIAGVYGQLARVAMVDVLTSLPNRRAFEEHFAFVFDNARRLRGSIGLIVIELDARTYQDDPSYRSAGDEWLRQLARELLRCATRPLDLVARFGGDRYVVVVPDTPLQGVLLIAERLEAVVEGFTMPGDAAMLERPAVAIGVGYTPNAQTCEQSALFAAAERAIDDAKKRGPNTVMLGSVEMGVRTEQILPVPSAVG